MGNQEQLEKLQSNLREKNEELDSMERICKYENEEEDIHWMVKKSERSNEELWNHFGGRKEKQYFVNLEQDEREYRKRIQVSFSEQYDEMERKRNVLIREREELSEKCIKMKRDIETSQKES